MCTFNVTHFLFPVGWIPDRNRGEILPGHQSLLHPQTRETRRMADGGDNIASLILLPFPAYTTYARWNFKKKTKKNGWKGKWGGGTFFFRPAKAAEGPRGFLKGENHRFESEAIVFCIICLIVFTNLFPKCKTALLVHSMTLSMIHVIVQVLFLQKVFLPIHIRPPPFLAHAQRNNPVMMCRSSAPKTCPGV